MDEAAYKAHTA